MDFGLDVFLAHPRMPRGEGVERGIDELAVRLGVFEFLQFLHPLVVFDAFHFHLGHLLVLHLVELLAQDDVRVFENGFDEREQHERVIRRLRVHAAESFRADTATAPGPSRNRPATRR